MDFNILFYLYDIASDLKRIIRNYKIKKNKNYISYNSEVVEKIELTVEIIFSILFAGKEKDEFDKKKLLILFLELVRASSKLKELFNLSKIGYNFYVEKKLFLEQIVELPEDEYTQRCEATKYNNILNKAMLFFCK